MGGFFGRNLQTDPKFHIEIQETQNSQNNLEKEQSTTPYFQIQNSLQRYSIQDSAVENKDIDNNEQIESLQVIPNIYG